MNFLSQPVRSHRIAWLALVVLLFAAGRTFAATFRFFGADDQNWGNGTNWENLSAPPAGGGDGMSDVFVRGAGGTALLQDFFFNDLDWHIRSLTFESQATGGWNHTGGTLFVDTITNNDASTHSFSNSQVVLTGVTTTVTAASGNLDFNADVLLDFSFTIGGATLNVNGGQSVFFDGGVVGSISLSPNSTLNISGTTFVRLGAGSTVFDTVNVSDGTLQLNAASILDTSANVSVSSGSRFSLFSFDSDIAQLTGSGDVDVGSGDLTVGDGSNNFTFSGVISGGSLGGLTKNGTGTMTLAGANTYAGATNITQGTLLLANSTTDGSLGSTDVNISSGAFLDMNGVNDGVDSIAGAGTILLGGGLLSVNEATGTRTFSGAIQETGELQMSGGGTLVLSGTNTFTVLDIDSGVVQVSSPNNLGSGSIELTGGELHATASFTNAKTINANSNGAINVSTGITLTQTGVISGLGSLGKNGNGTLVLSAANTYSGGTIINDGILQISAADRINNLSDVSLVAGATFDLNNFSDTVRSISGPGGTVDTGGSGGQLTVSAPSDTFFSLAASLAVETSQKRAAIPSSCRQRVRSPARLT